MMNYKSSSCLTDINVFEKCRDDISDIGLLKSDLLFMLQVNLKRFVKFRLEEEKWSNQSVANQSEDENKENQRKGNQFLFLIIFLYLFVFVYLLTQKCYK